MPTKRTTARLPCGIGASVRLLVETIAALETGEIGKAEEIPVSSANRAELHKIITAQIGGMDMTVGRRSKKRRRGKLLFENLTFPLNVIFQEYQDKVAHARGSMHVESSPFRHV